MRRSGVRTINGAADDVEDLTGHVLGALELMYEQEGPEVPRPG
jgi:hypothetical protein